MADARECDVGSGDVEPVRVLRIQSRICIGGPSLNTVYLSQYLKSRGYETLLVGGALDEGDRSMVPEARRRGIEVIEFGSMKRSLGPFADVLALFQIVAEIRRIRPQVVHTHTAKAGALGRLAAWICRVPVVVHTFHGNVFEGYFSPTVSRFFQFVERSLARMTDRLVAISPTQLDDLSGRFRIAPRSKFTCVPLGFELDRFKSCAKLRGELREELEISADVVLVGLVGRLVPIKNHAMLLEAVASMEVENQVQVLIVGEGHMREALEGLAVELGIADRVVFTGARSDTDRIYADLDIVALTSRNEGTPVTLIEAMAAGKAIVTTDVGGVQDILPADYGLVVASEDVPAFSNALARMVDDAGFRERSAAVSPDHIAMFEVERLAGDMDALYRELLGSTA